MEDVTIPLDTLKAATGSAVVTGAFTYLSKALWDKYKKSLANAQAQGQEIADDKHLLSRLANLEATVAKQTMRLETVEQQIPSLATELAMLREQLRAEHEENRMETAKLRQDHKEQIESVRQDIRNLVHIIKATRS